MKVKHRPWAAYERERLISWCRRPTLTLEQLAERMNRPPKYLRTRLRDLQNETRLKMARMADGE